MSDNLKKKKIDAKTISLSQDYEVKDWTKALRVTEKQLRDAVKAVGKSVAKVKKHLGK